MNSFLLIIIIFLFIIILIITIFYNKKTKISVKKEFLLDRYDQNPLLSPKKHNDWETNCVFNPAAYKDNNGTVHILYRAIGNDGISRLGYAKSLDGLSFTDRMSYPVFFIENPRKNGRNFIPKYDPVIYPSGGSWGGCEDPRLSLIDDRLYLTFNAFDGWDFIRIGYSSILEKDFISGRWNWDKPILISPDGEIHKNWLLFPEKINGKFAILHSISPDILIDYKDSLENIGTLESHIKSPVGPRNSKRDNSWDWNIRGAGSPPLKTKKGWLLLYHAIEKHEQERYKIGALLLDINDPTKIIGRSCRWAQTWVRSRPGPRYPPGTSPSGDPRRWPRRWRSGRSRPPGRSP